MGSRETGNVGASLISLGIPGKGKEVPERIPGDGCQVRRGFPVEHITGNLESRGTLPSGINVKA